jgi:hypothetical protein
MCAFDIARHAVFPVLNLAVMGFAVWCVKAIVASLPAGSFAC